MATSTNAAFPQYIYETRKDWYSFEVYSGETEMLEIIEMLRETCADWELEFDGKLSDCKEYKFMVDIAKNRAAYMGEYGDVFVFEVEVLNDKFFKYVEGFASREDMMSALYG